MDYKYKVSIIIPHYNTPGLLGKLLSTIPDRNDIQTIVIDDHSDEESKVQLRNLIRLYSDREILFLENNTSEHNAGTARNIGLDCAEGEWLLFADADDFFLPDFYDIIQKYFDTDYDIVFFIPESMQLDTDKKDLRNRIYLDMAQKYLNHPCRKTEITIRSTWLASWSKLIRSSVVKDNDIMFRPLKYCNDAMFSVKTGLFAKKIAVSYESIYCVTRHSNTLTTNLGIEAFDMYTRETIRVFQFLKANLSKKDMLSTGICPFAYNRLFTILRRKYGIRVFMRYFTLFWETGTFYIGLRMFNPIKVTGWFIRRMRDWADECTIRKRYEVRE